MAYDIDKLKKTKGGKAQETTDDNKTGEAGLYRHPETGAEAITQYDPLFGNAQSEAFIRVGFERVGDAPEGSVKTILELATEGSAEKAVASDRDALLKGALARLDNLEGAAEENKTLKETTEAQAKELEELRAQVAAADTAHEEALKSGEEAKANAEKSAKVQTETTKEGK